MHVQTEQQYKQTVNRIAFAMLLFLALTLAQGTVMGVLPLLTASLSATAADVIAELVGGILYAAVFSLPVLFFRFLPAGVPREPMYLSLRAPAAAPLYIFFGVAVIKAAAHLNAWMVSIFNYSEFSGEVIWDTDVTSNYQLVLMFFTVAVVPAFVEELLFRGLVLSNLLPYGRTTAILGSAFLFGLMHQNIEQLFYATVAGLVLGWIYVKTVSIWPCVLLHFFNNFQSVLQTGLLERLPKNTANAILYTIDGVLILAGILCGVLLLLRERDLRPSIRLRGAFEEALPADPDYAPRALPLGKCFKGFFTVPMIIFCVLCALTMLAYIGMAIFMF